MIHSFEFIESNITIWVENPDLHLKKKKKKNLIRF